jgi:hypothetical protein
LKVMVLADSEPALVANVAVLPLMVVAGLLQGLLLLAQAVTVAMADRQLRLALGSDSS